LFRNRGKRNLTSPQKRLPSHGKEAPANWGTRFINSPSPNTTRGGKKKRKKSWPMPTKKKGNSLDGQKKKEKKSSGASGRNLLGPKFSPNEKRTSPALVAGKKGPTTYLFTHHKKKKSKQPMAHDRKKACQNLRRNQLRVGGREKRPLGRQRERRTGPSEARKERREIRKAKHPVNKDLCPPTVKEKKKKT